MSSLMISAIGSEELSVSVNQTKKDGASSRPRFLPLVSDWSFVTKSCCQNNTKTIYYRTRFENFPGWQLVSLSTSMLCLYLSITVALVSDMYQTTNDHIAGNFQGRKLSRILRFYSHPRKFSPWNFRHATPIMRSVYIPQKFSPQNAPFQPIRESFLPWKFPAIRYRSTYLARFPLDFSSLNISLPRALHDYLFR